MPIEVIDEIVDKNGAGFPVTDQKRVKGGYQVFADLAERDAFDARKLTLGMRVFVVDQAKDFRLTALSPLTWVEIVAGGGGGGGITSLTGDVTASGTGAVAATIAALAVTDVKVATANKDGAVGTPSMRTLGTGALQAAAGNDPRLVGNEKSTNKDVLNGYAGLDVNARLVAARMPALTGAVTTAAGATATTISTGAVGTLQIADAAVTNAKLESMPSGTIKGQLNGGSGPPVNLTQSEARTVLAILSVGTTTGTVAAGDDARLVAAASASARLGLKTHTTNSFSVSFADPEQQLRDATGAVTITGLTGLGEGLGVNVVIRNTTAAAITVTVVPVLDWYTPATLSVPVGESATLSMQSTTLAPAGVTAGLRGDDPVVVDAGGRVVSAALWGLPGEWIPVQGSASSQPIGADNRLVFWGFTAHADITLTAALANVSTAGVAGGVGQLAIYDASVEDQTGYRPGAKIADLGGLVAVDSTGAKSVTGLSIALKRGRRYVLAFSASKTCSILRFPHRAPASHGWTISAVAGCLQLHIEAAYPPPASLAASTIVPNIQSGVPDYTPVLMRWTTP